MATAVAVNTAKTKVPPSSPFSLLLRRSRFATYDPAVKQTYTAPPAHVHRGDWGLKRPLAIKRRNANITLESYEHRAQFVEWNPADSQVRLVEQIEETGAKVKTATRSTWYNGLGKAQTQWLIDSEFAPEEGTTFGFNLSAAEDAPKQEASEQQQQPETIDLESLGNKGPGAYGAKRPLPPHPVYASQMQEVQVMPNIHAMTPKEFKRYLAHLRTLRPEFKDFIDAQTKPLTEGNPETIPAGKPLFQLAQNNEVGRHSHFLRQHARKLASDLSSVKFEPQPHPSGGLQYTHPTPLEVELHGTWYRDPQPGKVLHPWEELLRQPSGAAKTRSYAASFAGLVGQLRVNSMDEQAFLLDVNSEDGLRMNKDAEYYEAAMPNMKFENPAPKSNGTSFASKSLNAISIPERGLVLRKPPLVVGRGAQKDVDEIQIQADLVIDGSQAPSFDNDNPWEPGTLEYMVEEPVAVVSNKRNAARGRGSLHGYSRGALAGINVQKAPGRGVNIQRDENLGETARKSSLFGILRGMTGTEPKR